MQTMQTGSFFSGGGGIELGFEWEGFRVAYFCEKEEFCQEVLTEHWPGTPIYPDITKVDGAELPQTDVHTLGFPCQDVSNAGRRAGIKKGTRSRLWYEYARILGEMVRASKGPKYIVIENVPGLISSGGLGIVLADLERLGYQALQPVLLEAASVGAPHKRERIFIVAHSKLRGHLHPQAQEQPAEARESPQRDIGTKGDVADSRQFSKRTSGIRPHKESIHSKKEELRAGTGNRPSDSSEDVSYSKRTRLEGAIPKGDTCTDGRPSESRQRRRESNWWATEPSVGRVASGVPNRVDRLKLLGNAVVPQCAQVIAQAIRFIEAQRNENTTRKG